MQQGVSEGITASYNINWICLTLISYFVVFKKNDLGVPEELGLQKLYFGEFCLVVCTDRVIPETMHDYESL